MPPTHSRNPNLSRLSAGSRRRFLQAGAAAASGVMLSNCARALLTNASGAPTGAPTGPTSTAGSGNQTLRIYTWANYTDDELLRGFKDKTGIQVIADTYDSNETMLAKVQAGGGKDYSIIYPSDYMVEQMSQQGLLKPLDLSQLEGIDRLMEQWRNPAYDKNNAHSIPAVWGTTGLIFNPEIIQTEVKGWDYVWDNAADLPRQITLISDVREVMGATLKYLGYSLNSTTPSEINQAYKQLLAIKPAIASFITNGWEDQLAGGDLKMAMAYSQDAIALIAEKPALKYIVPDTGSSLWTDTMVIPTAAPNPDAAYAWLNFMLEPENAARMVKRLKISTPNAAAFDKLPANLQKDENLFPSKAVLAKSEGIVPVKEEISNLYDQYWTRLTSS